MHHQSKVSVTPVEPNLRSPLSQSLTQITAESLIGRIEIPSIDTLRGKSKCIHAVVVSALSQEGFSGCINFVWIRIIGFSISVVVESVQGKLDLT